MSLPRLLEPISRPKKKRKKAKKGESVPLPEQTSESLQLGDALRNQLRSRLDPIFNPAPPPDDVATPTPGSDSERERGKSTRGEEQLSEEMTEDDPPPHTQTPVESN